MSPRTRVITALILGVVGLVLLAAAVVALVLGVSVWRESSAAEAAYAAQAKLAMALGIAGIITSTTLTLWLLV